MMENEVGIHIAEALQKINMTQKELASQVGVTEAAISRYISGERKPKLNVLAQLAIALRTTSDALLGIERDEFDIRSIRSLIERNAPTMSEQDKKEIIELLLKEN